MTDSPTTPTRAATAADIAADLAIGIAQGLFRADEQLPSQTKLMAAYGVAMGTANAALSKLVGVGLARTVPGRGTFACDIWHAYPSWDRHPIIDILTASRMCRRVASTEFGRDDTDPDYPSMLIGGHRDWEDPILYDPEKHAPPIRVPVATLVGLDRNVLRWMSEAFLDAARRIVGAGEAASSDAHLVEAAFAIVRDGGQRPDHQVPIAQLGGPVPRPART